MIRHLTARWGPGTAVFALALGARMIPAFLNGGLTGNYGYDAAVYYAAADGFVHGRMPYRDFVLLHPPGMMLAESPFAALGTLTSDRIGFAAANIAFAVIGAISAVLVWRVARLLGMPQRAALVGGVVYALWFGSISAEFLARLEPLGCLLFLSGLLAMLHSQRAGAAGQGRRAAWLALLSGIAFGAGASVKIWWIVPVLVVIGWQLVPDRAPGRAARMALGALLAGLVIDLPFLLIAGHRMWQLVVLDQLGRPVANSSLLRPASFLTFGWLTVHASHRRMLTAAVVGGVVLAVIAWRAWRIRSARLFVLVLVVQLVQIAASPSWFTFYADFITVALSLVIAAAFVPRRVDAAAGPGAAQRDERLGWPAPLVALALAVSLFWTMSPNLLGKFPSTQLAAAAKPYKCVLSDSPQALIDMNRLSRNFHNGCPNLVDVTGVLYDLLRGVHPLDAHNARWRSALRTWNVDMLHYLRSGEATIFLRDPKLISLLPATVSTIEADGVILTVDGLSLYRVTRAPGQAAPPSVPVG